MTTRWFSAMLLSTCLTLCLGCESSNGPEADPQTLPDMGTESDSGPVGTPAPIRFAPSEDLAATPLGLIPFPNDVYRDESGRLDLRGFPGQVSGSILERLVTSVQELTDGFGTSAGHYLGFTAPIFEGGLPESSADSIRQDSSLFLVDVDPASPEYGRRLPINWRNKALESTYLPPHTLAIRLVEGAVLRPATRYAFGVTTDVAVRSEAFAAVMAPERGNDTSERLWNVYEPLRAWASDSGVDVATGAVFTTQDPVSEMFRLRDYVAELPSPEVYDLQYTGKTADVFEVYTGKYRAPRFQQGALPYLEAGTGAIAFEDDGTPIVQGEEELRFALSIPLEQDMPPEGWPVVLYGHGTGGDFRSFIGAKVALTLARAGIAVLSIDQIHHAYRDKRADGCHTMNDPASCVSLVFFNFLVPAAGRDNVRQSALDFVSLLKVAQGFDFEIDRTRRSGNNDPGDEAPAIDSPDGGVNALGDAGVPQPDGGLADQGIPVRVDAGIPDAGSLDAEAIDASVRDSGPMDTSPSIDGSTVADATMDANSQPDQGDLTDGDVIEPDAGNVPSRLKRVILDPARVVYMGHSQGGLNGPLFLAVEPNVLGGVLSAAGAQISVTLEQKTKPLDINEFVQQVVPFAEGDPADRWHPVFSLLQTFIGPGDPVNYAARWFMNPPEGYEPKDILMTAGLEDEYTPPDSIFALAAAGGVPIVEPVLREIELFEVLGIEPAGIPPYSGNVGGGAAAAGVIQLNEFGHFAIQRSNTLRNRYRRFIESVVNGQGSVF